MFNITGLLAVDQYSCAKLNTILTATQVDV
jgi:hypothetical protein